MYNSYDEILSIRNVISKENTEMKTNKWEKKTYQLAKKYTGDPVMCVAPSIYVWLKKCIMTFDYMSVSFVRMIVSAEWSEKANIYSYWEIIEKVIKWEIITLN